LISSLVLNKAKEVEKPLKWSSSSNSSAAKNKSLLAQNDKRNQKQRKQRKASVTCVFQQSNSFCAQVRSVREIQVLRIHATNPNAVTVTAYSGTT
jgi:hypothetical protein